MLITIEITEMKISKKRVMSCKFQRNCKLQIFMLKLGVANYELNFQLDFSKTYAESNFETASC